MHALHMNKYNKKKMLEAPPPFIFHTSFHTITHTISSSSLGQIRLVEPYLKGAYLPFCFLIHKINMYFYPLLFAYIPRHTRIRKCSFKARNVQKWTLIYYKRCIKGENSVCANDMGGNVEKGATYNICIKFYRSLAIYNHNTTFSGMWVCTYHVIRLSSQHTLYSIICDDDANRHSNI